jgi:hypothetical protein
VVGAGLHRRSDHAGGLAAAASLNAMADDPALAPGIEQMHGAEVISSDFHFGMLTIAVLGALLITGEYATGLIRSTFAAVPTRIPVLAAKALTLVILTAAVTIEVSYRVTGDESGPRQKRFEIVGGQPEFDREEFAGTRSSGTVLKAKVIEVSYTEN